MRLRVIFHMMLLLALVLGFQNCGTPTPSNTGQDVTTLQGNGDPYDGKLTVNAPDVIVPGQSIEVRVQGGEGPYQMASSSATGVFVETSPGVYQFTLAQTEPSGELTITVTDANSDQASVQVNIWGVNKWFFASPQGLALNQQNYLFMVEEGRGTLTQLNLDGDIIGRTSLDTVLANTSGSYSKLGIDSKNILYVLKDDSRIEKINSVSLLPEGRIEDLSQSYWNSCGGIKDFNILPSDQVAITCENRVFVINQDSNEIQSYSISIGSDESIGAFILFEDEQRVLVSVDGGFVEEHSLDTGNRINRYRMNESFTEDIESLKANRLVVVGDQKIAFIPRDDHTQLFAFSRLSGEPVELFRQSEDFVHHAEYRDLVVLSDGRFVASENSSNEVLIYNGEFNLERTFGPQTRELGAFYYPTGIFCRNEIVTVIDSWNLRVVQFTLDGQLVRSINGPDNDPFWVKTAKDVLVDNDGIIFIPDPHAGKIIRIENNGLINEIGNMESPVAVAELNADTLLVSQTWAKKVSAYSKQGQFLFDFSESPGFVSGISVSENFVAVIDWEYGNVQKYTAQGQFIELFESLPPGLGTLSEQAQNIVFDSLRQQFYVTDTGNNRIVVYSASGEFIKVIGQFGYHFGEFNAPTGITLDSQGNIFVSDKFNSRIQILDSL